MSATDTFPLTAEALAWEYDRVTLTSEPADAREAWERLAEYVGRVAVEEPELHEGCVSEDAYEERGRMLVAVAYELFGDEWLGHHPAERADRTDLADYVRKAVEGRARALVKRREERAAQDERRDQAFEEGREEGVKDATVPSRATAAQRKALRLLVDGKLVVERVWPADGGELGGLVVGSCRGDSGEVYRLGYDPRRRQWRCTCPEVRGQCSHLTALRMIVPARPS